MAAVFLVVVDDKLVEVARIQVSEVEVYILELVLVFVLQDRLVLVEYTQERMVPVHMVELVYMVDKVDTVDIV